MFTKMFCQMRHRKLYVSPSGGSDDASIDQTLAIHTDVASLPTHPISDVCQAGGGRVECHL